MGNHTDVDYLHGIVIPDERITFETMNDRPLTGVGAAVTESDYSQASPVPGIPESDHGSAMTLEASGSQTDKGHLEILTQRAGNPRQEDAGFVWRDRDAGDSATEYKGHDGYQAATGFDPVIFSTTSVYGHHPSVLRMNSGKVLMTGHSHGTTRSLEVYEYDPDTSAWSQTGSPGHTCSAQTQACMVQTGRKENGASFERVLLLVMTTDDEQVDVYASDDEGATWFEHARRVLDTVIRDSSGVVPATFERMSAAYAGGEILLLIAFTDAGTSDPDVWHFASGDLGGTFDQIEETYHATDRYLAQYVNVIGYPGGGFGIGGLWRVETAGPFFYWGFRRLGSAFSIIGDLDVETDDNASSPTFDEPLEVACWLDEDGIVYYLCMHGRGTTPDPYRYRMFRSIDAGSTWYEVTAYVFNFEQTANYISQMVATSTGGRAVLCSRFTAAAGSYSGNSTICTYLGGYGTHTLPDSNADPDQNFADVNALTWADTVDDTGTALCWIPIAKPDVMGWTNSGTATATIVNTGELQLSSTGITNRSYSVDTTNDEVRLMYEFHVRINADDGDKTTDDIAAKAILGDGATYESSIEIRLEDDGFNVYDVIAAANVSGSPVAIALTSTTRFRVAMLKKIGANSAHVQVWTATDSHVTEWTEQIDADISDAGGAAANTDSVSWGHYNNVANISHWQFAAFTYLVHAWSERDDVRFGDTWTNPDSLRPRALSSLPQLVYDGVKLAATSGPTRIGETWQIEADSEYPASAVDPRITSSPGRGWRSADDSSEQILCWDLEPDYVDSGTWENDAIACFVFGANWETAYFEAYNSSAGWVTLDTLVASDGFTTLKFTRRGRILYPDTSQTTDGKHYFFREEHAGDTFDLGAAGDGGVRYHHIAHNAEGAWRGTGTTTKRPRVVLERDNLVATDPASGTGELWRRDFGVIVSNMEAAASYQHVRLRIPAQDTADGDLRIGTIVIGSVSVLARPYDWGWEYVHVQPISITNRPDDSIAARTTGKMRREIRFGWATTGMDVKQASEDTPSPDYVAIDSSDVPAGVEHDTARNVEGIVRRCEQAACPVLLLTAIKHLAAGNAQKESRSRAMLFGRITTDPMTTTVLGDEGVDELERLQTITMTEEV